MYLSDLIVAAWEEGGEDCVKQTVRLLTRLPSEWWQIGGCQNWLVVAMREIDESPDTFFKKLERYAGSNKYKKGNSFEKELDTSA